MQEIKETWVPSLGQEYPLEKEIATCFTIFAWKIPWKRSMAGYMSMESQRVRQDRATEHKAQLYVYRFIVKTTVFFTVKNGVRDCLN